MFNQEKMDRWLKALESDEFNQTKLYLTLPDALRVDGHEDKVETVTHVNNEDRNDAHCCMGIHVEVNEGGNYVRCRGGGNGTWRSHIELLSKEAASKLGLDSTVTPEDLIALQKLMGSEHLPTLLYSVRMYALSELNDGGYTFKQIRQFVIDRGWNRPPEQEA